MSDPIQSDLSTLLALLGRTDSHVRLGIQAPGQAFTPLRVRRADLDATLHQIADTANLWFEVNPSTYALESGRSSATHISRLTALWCDIDYKEKPGGMGSEPEALDLLADLESALGTPATVVVHSGHGIQPYWPIAGAGITDANRDAVATLLKRWGALVQEIAGTHSGHVDNVYDLPRILRVPGSTNLKDPGHPVEVRLDVRDAYPALTLDEIEGVLDDWNVALSASVETSTTAVSEHEDWEWADENCGFFATAMREIAESNPTARHPWALKWASLIYGMVRYECVTELGYSDLVGALRSRFQALLSNDRGYTDHEFDLIMKAGLQKAESWSPEKHHDEMRGHQHQRLFEALTEQQPAPISNVTSLFTRQPVIYADPPRTSRDDHPSNGNVALNPSPTAQRLVNANFTDTGNGERLAQAFRGRFINVAGIGWMVYEGGRYVPDSTSTVMETAKDIFVQMSMLAPSDAGKKWAHSSLSRARLRSAIDLASSVPDVGVRVAQLDASSTELNTPAGVVDLSTGTLRTPDPLVDLNTKRTTVAPAPGTPVQFLNFLDWAMKGDGEKQEYLQQLFGLAALGEVRQHLFPIFRGTGANGKSALMEVIIGVLGDYAIELPAKFLVEKRGEDHPTVIAQLRGVRLAVAREVPPTAVFAEELVKEISGEKTLRARLMGEDFFTFRNQVLLVLLANHLPRVVVGGPSFWRRTRTIDFFNSMPEQRQDPLLSQRLLDEEGPQILQWIIDGAVKAIHHGVATPASVLEATKDYARREDHIGLFLAEMYRPATEPGAVVDALTMFQQFQQWQIRRGVRATWTYDRFNAMILETHPEYRADIEGQYAGLKQHAIRPAGWAPPVAPYQEGYPWAPSN